MFKLLSLKKLVIGGICAAVVIGIIFTGRYLIRVQKYKSTVAEIKVTNIDVSKIKDGVYTGSCDALIIGAKVKVEVKDHKISSISFIEHKYDRGKPAEAILQRVVSAQSLEVDTVSGATNSSRVILKAIENALVKGQE
jgi:uncharacterized protein with FMN-binding domain